MILVRRSLVAGAILALFQVAPALAQSGVPDGSIGIRLLEAPQHLADDPRALLYIIDHLNQGDTIRRRIEVTVDPTSVDLSPHGSATALVTIAVPEDAEDGERYAVVWAQTPPSSPSDGEVVTVDRVGIRVYLSVGRGGAPPTDFRIESLTASRDDTGSPIVSAAVLNTGGRAIDVSGTLRLSEGPGGLSAGPFPVQLGTTIGIGQRGTVQVVLSRSIPDGPWTADLRLRSDLVKRQAQARITFPSAPGTGSTPVPASPVAESLGVLAVIAAIGLALAAGLWLLFLWRRRRKSEPDDEGTIDRPVGRPQESTLR
jgi:hypothetical protein